MIIFLYGPDTYRSQQKLNDIVVHYKEIHRSGLNLRYFDFEEDTFEDLKNALRISSMFREKKLLVLKNAFSNQDFKKRFLDLGEDFVKSDNIVLFYKKEEVSKKDPLFVFLKKEGKCQEFKLLQGKRLENWIEREIKKYGTEINYGAKRLLLDYVGNDLWRLSNEIKKLVSYKSQSKDTKIFKEDVKDLVRARIETDIFKTIDAIAKRNKKKALVLLHKHSEKGDSPLYLLSMINFQFRNLLMIKEKSQKVRYPQVGKLSKELKLHPFVVRKGLRLSENFSFEELKKIYQKLFETDLKIKTGQIEPEMGLDLLITEI